jgi:hypothetical protein
MPPAPQFPAQSGPDAPHPNTASQVAPVVRFIQLIPGIRPPQRADRTAAGTMPIRAARYCDAITTVCAWGWWVFPPLDLSFYWDGDTVFWSCAEFPDWMALDDAAQFPHLAPAFDQAAPPAAQGCAPPFLTRLPEPGTIQLWTGLMARTASDWSLNIRPPVNLPPQAGIALFEGMLEADLWAGPLFANLRLTRTHHPIRLTTDLPLLQIQPIPRHAYADSILNTPTIEPPTQDDWAAYIRDIVTPNLDPNRPPGRYATTARKRRKCPVTGAAA